MFHLRTFGGLTLERDRTPVEPARAQRKTLAILALLAAAHERGISRERITSYLWPESDSERARGALNQALHALRRQLESPEAILGTAELRLNAFHVGSDVGAFLSAVAQGQLARAADLYTGPFLDGFNLPRAGEFERWVDGERADLARRHGAALTRLADAAESAGDFLAAAEWWQRLHAADPLDARALLRLMRTLAAGGDIPAALRYAQAHEGLVRAELASAPAVAVTAYAEELRRASRAGPAAKAAMAETALGVSAPPRSIDSADAASGPAETHAVATVEISAVAMPRRARLPRRAFALAVVTLGAIALLALAGIVASARDGGRRPASEPGATTSPPANVRPEAYALYLRGRNSWKLRTPAGFRDALAQFEEAVERDPGFARGFSALAEAYVNLANFGLHDLEEALTRAGAAADRALELDQQHAHGHAAKGFVLASQLRVRESEEALRRAIAIEPDYPWAHHYYSLLLLMEGRIGEAAAQNALTLRLDPLSLPANATRGIIASQRGQLDEAEADLERAMRLAGDFPLTLYYLGALRARQERYTDAASLLERASGLAPDFPGVAGAIAHVHAHTGRALAADSILAGLRARRTERGKANLALALAATGQLDPAFPLLHDVRWDVPALIALRADPLLQQLRDDPRYGALLTTIGVP